MSKTVRHILYITAILVLAIAVLVDISARSAVPPITHEVRAPIAANNMDPADIITMPEGFSNLATKCDHGNRVYVARSVDDTGVGRAIWGVANDPTCK